MRRGACWMLQHHFKDSLAEVCHSTGREESHIPNSDAHDVTELCLHLCYLHSSQLVSAVRLLTRWHQRHISALTRPISPQAFSVVFQKAVLRADPDEALKQRVSNLIDSITSSVFQYTTRGLFECDKLTYIAQLAFQVRTGLVSSSARLALRTGISRSWDRPSCSGLIKRRGDVNNFFRVRPVCFVPRSCWWIKKSTLQSWTSFWGIRSNQAWYHLWISCPATRGEGSRYKHAVAVCLLLLKLDDRRKELKLNSSSVQIKTSERP